MKNRKYFYQILPVAAVCALIAIVTLLSAHEARHHLPALSESHDQDQRALKIEQLIETYEELQWFGTLEAKEIKRLMMKVESLRVFLDGKYEDYLEFVFTQPKEKRLAWAQFQALNLHARSLIAHHPSHREESIRKILETALVLSEMGNSDIARNKGWMYEISALDDLEFVQKVLNRHPEIFPSFMKLSMQEQELLKKIIRPLSFDALTTLEGGKEPFCELARSHLLIDAPDLFELSLLLYQCHIAALSADKNSLASLTFTKERYEDLQMVRKACLLSREEGADNAFNFYLETRGAQLGLDTSSPLNRALTRIGALLSLYTVQEGKALKSTFLRLAPEELSTIVEAFNSSPEKDHPSLHLGHFLHNLASNPDLGSLPKERLVVAIQIGIPFIVKVLHHHKANIAKQIYAPSLSLNFYNPAKEALYAPFRLQSAPFAIAKDGSVAIL